MQTLLMSAPCQSGQPATIEAEADLYDAPLGVLVLAAVLERNGMPVSVVDPDAWRNASATSGDTPEDWPDRFAGWLAQQKFEVYGFSTICSSFPATLRTAMTLKSLRPDAQIILGGPQASVTDEACMRQFKGVDYIVRGEADETLPRLIDAIASRGHLLDLLPGITFRAGGGIRRNAPAIPVANLDLLPLPAYHLLGELHTVSRAAIELGRGCPFACKFCSTNDFFRRNFRLKSPAVIIEHMRTLEARYGTRVFSLVHDMFTVNRKAVIAFCRALLESGATFEWSCSARTDCVDRELLRLMADAGCRGVFFGVETGSARLQKIIDKNLDLANAREIVLAADQCQIATTLSLITGFPEESNADLRDTLAFLIDSARFDSTEPQLHILAPLAGTPIERMYRGRLRLDDTGSDISGAVLSDRDLQYVRRHPEIFPNFYSVPCPALDRCHLNDVRSFVLFGLDVLRWLFVALHQTTGHILDVYHQWLSYRHHNANPVFRSSEGIRLFLTFAADRYGSHLVVATLVAYYRGLLDWSVADEPAGNTEPGPYCETTIPLRRADIRLVRVPGSLAILVDHMRHGTCSLFLEASPGVVVVKRSAGSKAEVLHMPALGTLILELCDGARDLAGIAAAVSESGLASHIQASCLTIVAEVCSQFQRDGLVSFHNPLATLSHVSRTPGTHEGALASLA